MLHMLHAENVLFYVKDLFKIFFLCEFSAILTKLTEFYYFLTALGFVCSFVFQAEKMLLNVWFIIGVCVFNRI